MPNRVVVSSAEFIRNIGHWQSEALRGPVSITHHGRERLILAASDLFRASAVADEQTKQEVSSLRAVQAALLENFDDGYMVFDPQLRLVSVNRVAEAFIGRAREELQSGSFLDALPELLGSVLADRLQRVARARQAETFEWSAPNGIHLSIRVFPCGDGVAALFHNTTEEHDLRRRLEAGVALEAAVQRHPGAVCLTLDARARILAVNDAFLASSGFTASDVQGHRLFDLISGGQRREAANLFERAMRDAKPAGLAVTMLGKKGEESPGHLTIAPILMDFVSHGAQAVWTAAAEGDESEQRAA